MADPTLQTFCCVQSNETRLGADVIQFWTNPYYNSICIASSVCGILGGIYQILPRERTRMSDSYSRGRYIIVWLATADLFASLAVLIRSTSWLIKGSSTPENPLEYSLSTLFCAISSGWIQYFYTAACLWTFCYALDVLQILYGKKETATFYHILSWGLPAIFSITGLSILYYPDLNCHDMGTNAFARILPNYVFTYVPITFVMIANPLIYLSASRKAESKVFALGRYTENERKQLRTLRLKFFMINFILFICWIPNLINAFLIWTTWSNLPKKLLLADWYVMAILNPLQALLNALVYRKWDGKRVRVIFPWEKTCPGHQRRNSFNVQESAHLLSSQSFDVNKTTNATSYGSL